MGQSIEVHFLLVTILQASVHCAHLIHFLMITMQRTLFALLVFSLAACAPAQPPKEETPPAPGPAAEEPSAVPQEPEPIPTSQVRRIDMSVDNWSFTPATIIAKQGEAVEVRLTGVGGTHGFAAPGLGINSPITAGESVTVTIPTGSAGTYEFFCSIPCGSGHRDMRGTIVIAP